MTQNGAISFKTCGYVRGGSCGSENALGPKRVTKDHLENIKYFL